MHKFRNYYLSLLFFVCILGFFFSNVYASIDRNDCDLDGKLIQNGKSGLFFSTEKASFGKMCESFSQLRVCNNGLLSGQAKYSKSNCTEFTVKKIKISSPLDGQVFTQTFNINFDLSNGNFSSVNIHAKGPIGLPKDKDSIVKVVNSTELSNSMYSGFIDVTTMLPGNYILYVDYYDKNGIRIRSKDVNIRFGPTSYKPSILFDSDYTHILNVESPYNVNASNTRHLNESLNKEKIQLAFSEIVGKGFDLVLSPGVGEVGYYKNKYYSLEQHQSWWYKTTGRLPSSAPLVNYVLKSDGDPINDAKEVTDRFGKKLYVSIRMDDGHAWYINGINKDTGKVIAGGSADLYSIFSQFQSTHPELRTGMYSILPDGSPYQYLLDYSLGATGTDPVTGLKNNVLEHKKAIVTSMLDDHKVDGIVLDFMRLPYMFNLSKTSSAQRKNIMQKLVKDIRIYLDGQYREKNGSSAQLIVRIPYIPEEWDKLGVSPEEMALAGVDVIVFSFDRDWKQPFYYGNSRERMSRLDTWKQKTGPGVTYLFEMNFATDVRYIKLSNDKNFAAKRRTTKEQIISGAYSAYTIGAEGFYFFNFPYYRGINAYQDPEVRTDLPWEEMICTKSFDCVSSKSNINYFLTPKRMLDYMTLPKSWLQLPGSLTANSWKPFVIYSPRPKTGFTKFLLLRVELNQKTYGANVSAKIGDSKLLQIETKSEPYNNPYKYALNNASTTYSFVVPSSLVVNDQLKFSVMSDLQTSVESIDLTALPESAVYCSLGNSVIEEGASVKVYKSATVPFDTKCVSVERKCVGGVLTGDSSYGETKCSVEKPKSCSLDTAKTKHGSKALFFKQVVPAGKCKASEYKQIRECYNGEYKGDPSFNKRSCNNEVKL